jgi:hypothetical protein
MADAGFSAVFVEKGGIKIELMNYKGKNVPKRLDVAKLRIGVSSIPINDHNFLYRSPIP